MKIRNNNLTTMLLGSLILLGMGSSLSACVEDKASLSLSGSVIFEGELDEGPPPVLRCDERSAQPGSVDMYFHAADLNLAQGQALTFNAELTNLLEESNQQIGTDETFPGLYQDQNQIRLTSVTVEYPSELNNFPGGDLADQLLGRPELPLGALIDSGGGGRIMRIYLYEPRAGVDQGRFEEFYTEVVTRSGHGEDTTEAIIPLVARIKFEGKTLSGEKVESNTFDFPVRLCADCELETTPQCLERM